MEHFKYHQGHLYAEDVDLRTIAKRYGSPCYVYSRAALEAQYRGFTKALSRHLSPDAYQLNYAVKANSNLAILNVFARLGAGFDIVSKGELARVLKAGGNLKQIVFSGVGKTALELNQALELGLGCINVESRAELLRLNTLAEKLNKSITIALRINPDVNANSHPYISTGRKENKFGIPLNEAKELYLEAQHFPLLKTQGLAFHIGSQITSLAPFVEALDKALVFIDELKAQNIHIKDLNVGGGLGVTYLNETPPDIESYVAAICDRVKNRDLTLHLEPGRALVAESGLLLTKVEYIKPGFVIVDAGMNDLLRPALYDAWHNIIPVSPHTETKKALYDIVGPVCETGDFLGKDRELALKENDLLAIMTTGAYGFSMSSQYNSRPRAAEIMVDKNKMYLIRASEQESDLFSTENILPS